MSEKHTLKRLIEYAQYYEMRSEETQPTQAEAAWRTLANNYRLQALCRILLNGEIKEASK